MAKKILVTGMSGLIGGLAGRDLARDYTVSALNRRPVKGVPTTEGDINDFDTIRPAFDDIDMVVHMAAYLGVDEREQIRVNVGGTYNVFEAARDAGVSRIVFGSSGAVQSALEKYEPIKAMVEVRLDDVPEMRPIVTHKDPVRPGEVYGVAKTFGEALGCALAERDGISVLCVRLGRVRPENRPMSSREAAVYLSHRDAAQIVRRCVEAPPEVLFDIFYGVSDNFLRYRDLEHAREVIGYEPEDGGKEWPVADSWRP